MSIFQRVVLLIKVLVLMSLGMSAAWAHNPVQSQAGLSAVQSEQGKPLQLAKSEAEPGDQDQGGSKDDDDTTNDPDSDDPDDDDGDSQT
ncbi:MULTISPECIES: hypothetical protein [Pseudomonas]|jgi:hypothetical protein|uniref:Uncharacterized protein n=1 Tax=Pseudomonas grimontii TaxID=129847 RepID=A0A1H1J120_9PSED|nr:hypothetical protein [Pseudomonas grimontii]MCS3511689.1 hypothetical protein [Pseudomonas grimontii]TWR69903.1 hypothetical protein FIV39_00785 [Pseudomonas grimontii]SDR43490.1 hypothetical protein SAMN04490186_6583 [Pseudomonas grimontii]